MRRALAEAAHGRLLTLVVVGTSVALRLAFLIHPFDLHGVSDFHELGRRMLDGALPYRDFTFEYPPLTAPLVLLAGAVPRSVSVNVLAAVAFLAEVVLLFLLRHEPPVVRRYLLLTLPLVPLLSGGFDAIVVLALGGAMVAAAAGSTARGAWAAAAGTLVKLFSAVWLAADRPSRRTFGPIAVTAAGLLAPLLVAPFNDTYLGFAARRGVHQQAVAASLHTLTTWPGGGRSSRRSGSTTSRSSGRAPGP